MLPLHKACYQLDKDDNIIAGDEIGIRYAQGLQYIRIDKDYVLCSDGRIAIKHSTQQLFGNAFISQLSQDEAIYIHHSEWRKLIAGQRANRVERQVNFLEFIYDALGQLVKVSYQTCMPNGIEFPDITGQFRKRFKKMNLTQISINARLLATIQDCFDSESCTLMIEHHSKQIRVKPYASLYGRARALLMPMKPEDD